jgi:hypothetical protein
MTKLEDIHKYLDGLGFERVSQPESITQIFVKTDDEIVVIVENKKKKTH